MTGAAPAGLLVERLTGMLFEMLGRTAEGPRQPYSTVSVFATSGYRVVSDLYLETCFRAWPLIDPAARLTVKEPLPMGCRWCGHARTDHYRWPTQPVGYHRWTEPSVEQVNRRMWLRYEMRPAPVRRRVGRLS